LMDPCETGVIGSNISVAVQIIGTLLGKTNRISNK